MMSTPFAYLWAKDVVLGEMERDGLLRRAERLAMSAEACGPLNGAYGDGLIATGIVGDGYAAAAAVFARLALTETAPGARPALWAEAARRAILRSPRIKDAEGRETYWSGSIARARATSGREG